MSTNIPVGSALARKIYSVGLFTRVQHSPGFMNLISGEMPKEGSFAAKTKGQTYKLSREIAKRFGEKNTTTVCGTLKGIGSDKGPLRSCPGCIDDAVEIACDVLKQLAE